jgi:lipid II:glycine glycyltransferase (peptidoglycan interpeptide bridge formation enzyme)
MDDCAASVLTPPAPPGAAHSLGQASPVTPPSAPEPAADRWEPWDRFLEATPETGFMQASWWADFRTTVGYDHFAMVAREQGAILGGALVQKYSYAPGHGFYYIQDGPVIPADEEEAAAVFGAILDAVESHRQSESMTISHLRIEPRWQRLPAFVTGFQPPPGRDTYVEPRHTLCIDLRPSELDILAQMKPKGRYNIRVAQRRGVAVVQDASGQGIADFLSLYRDMAKRQGIPTKPDDYFETLVPLLAARGKGTLFFAEHHGRWLAAALVVFFGPRATYFYGASLDADRHVMAPYLLHFEIMRQAKARGHQAYDLWGVAPENAPDHRWRDISAFKRKFGGADFRLVSTLDYIYDSAGYRRYTQAK